MAFAWEPTPEIVERANVTRLMRAHGIGSYAELVRRSHEDLDWFWPAAIADMGLEFAAPWTQVVDQSRGPEWATWFTGARVSIASNCLHRWAARRPRDEAYVLAGEDGSRQAWTFAEASAETTRLAEGLAALGVGPGDVVGTFLPMVPEAAIAGHAVAHLGAIQVPVFSGFAPGAVATRLADAGVKAVITADGSLRRGRALPMKEILDEAIASVPSVEHVVVRRRLERDDVPMTEPRDVFWDDLVAGRPGTLPPLDVDAETPYLLAYTSGTTGRPKGVVQVQGGFLVSIAREACYAADAGPEDTILFCTDMGWIMGPWTVVGGGAMGSRIVFLEGAPDWPADRLWTTVERERVTILGLSPTLARGLVAHGPPTADLSSLRIFVTTGEPWNPEPWRWLLEDVGGRRCPVINISGGTEIGAVILGATPVCPLKPCSLWGPMLGMAADIVDADGRPVRGEVGELVIRKPFPGMTRGLWRDPERYLESYWRRFPGVWTHGDWASVDADGHWYVHGRSDDTLNIAGKRIGPAEIESAIVSHEDVLEAAAVGIPHELKGEAAWVFCVAAPGAHPDGEAVADHAARELGKAFRPERVVFVAALPKTRSAKIVRRAVRAAALGHDPGDLSSVENPDAIEAIGRLVLDHKT
jgi:acetyl-CoA synthetase